MIIRDPKTYFLILLLTPFFAVAELSLPAVFSDGMIIQRNQSVKFWGWADPGETILVSFLGEEVKATVDKEGGWRVTLSPREAGGPYEVRIASKGETLTIQNVLIGDVWLCSGQSNMVHYFERYQQIYAEEIANSDNEMIRQYLVPTTTSLTGPQKDLAGGSWQSADPENLIRFSVVAYFFAKHLYDQYKVPIGIVNSSVGGTPIEAWTSEAGLAEFDQLLEKIKRNKDTAAIHAQSRKTTEARNAWYRRPLSDKGLLSDPKWYEPEFEPDFTWKRIAVPGYWEDQGVRSLDGVVWYRKEIDLSEQAAQKQGFLELGRIIDADEVYINGQKVGGISYQYPPRRYEVPGGLLQSGLNTLVVRITNQGGKGGFVPDKPYYLEVAGERIPLEGYWAYKVGEVFKKTNFPSSVSLQNQPTALYNAMVAPYTDLRVKGICWYQGESNAGRPEEYAELLPAYINDYRKQFEQPDMPVIVIQLPNYLDVNYLPEESSWAEMRAVQSQVAEIDRVDYVVTIDLGEWNDIHPMRKKPVGERAALVARHLVYGEKDLVYSGPRLIDYEEKDSKVTLTFDQVGNGLVAKGGSDLRHFAIAGEDGHFVWATAEIQGNQVVVWNDSIEEPMYLRYAWADNPDFANLYNEEGLPAAPFRIELDK